MEIHLFPPSDWICPLQGLHCSMWDKRRRTDAEALSLLKIMTRWGKQSKVAFYGSKQILGTPENVPLGPPCKLLWVVPC